MSTLSSRLERETARRAQQVVFVKRRLAAFVLNPRGIGDDAEQMQG
jgi:hypothetical protein